MRNVYLIQPNYGTGSGEFTSHWLPYSVGCLWAYAARFEDIVESYRLAGLYFKRTPIDRVVANMRDPSVVGFSHYIWNARYNLALARAVKARWPAAVVVFGGPEVPDRPDDFLRTNSCIDVTVHQEGELTFTTLLREHLRSGPELHRIPGISFSTPDGQVVKNEAAGRIDVLEELPSPYLAGTFDALVRDNPNVQWAGTYETNRGCPFKCRFCDWGSVIFSKVKRFPEERVRDDLDWLADNRVEYVFVADANFGIFRERDDAIADHMLEVVGRTGYPKTFCIQWTKNSNEEIVQMARKLGSVQKGLTLSVQSMTEEVLTAVERRNMAINNLEEILDICNREQLPSYTELILGLPGETLSSWKDCFHRLLDLGQHCAIDIWIAQVLENSALNDADYIETYGIETVRARDYLTATRSPADGSEADIPEEIRLIRSTRSMPFDDLVDAYLYSWMIMNFHLYGWTQLFARFMKLRASVPYKDFYRELYDYVRSDATRIIHGEYARAKHRFAKYMTTGEIDGNLKDEIGLDLEFSGHNLMWLSQMVFRYHGRELFEELKPFFARFDDRMSPNIREDLLLTQEEALVFFGASYPREFSIGSNLVESVLLGHSLETGDAHHYVADYHKEIRGAVADIDTIDLSDFLYMLYYKRRMAPGTTTIARAG